jgi:hypothetical protein
LAQGSLPQVPKDTPAPPQVAFDVGIESFEALS